MKCIVVCDCMVRKEEKLDSCNRGTTRKHTDNNIYLKMKILETFMEPLPLKGCQRTWSKYTVV